MPHLPHKILRGHDTRGGKRVHAQQVAPARLSDAPLAHGQGDEIIHETTTKDPVAPAGQGSEAHARHGLDGQARALVVEVGDGAVVQEIQDADAGERLRDDVREDGRRGARVHGPQAAEDVVQLRQGVNEHEDIGCLQRGGVPEDHPSCLIPR